MTIKVPRYGQCIHTWEEHAEGGYICLNVDRQSVVCGATCFRDADGKIVDYSDGSVAPAPTEWAPRGPVQS